MLFIDKKNTTTIITTIIIWIKYWLELFDEKKKSFWLIYKK